MCGIVIASARSRQTDRGWPCADKRRANHPRADTRARKISAIRGGGAQARGAAGGARRGGSPASAAAVPAGTRSTPLKPLTRALAERVLVVDAPPLMLAAALGFGFKGMAHGNALNLKPRSPPSSFIISTLPPGTPPPSPTQPPPPNPLNPSLEAHWSGHHGRQLAALNRQLDADLALKRLPLEELVKVAYNGGNPLPCFNLAAEVGEVGGRGRSVDVLVTRIKMVKVVDPILCFNLAARCMQSRVLLFGIPAGNRGSRSREVGNRPEEEAWNHEFFFSGLQPADEAEGREGGNRPEGEVLRLVERDFGSVEGFQREFRQACALSFGSGYVWLSAKVDTVVPEEWLADMRVPNTYRLQVAHLRVERTVNAFNPLVFDRIPLTVLDLWEHSYLSDYPDNRSAYVEAFLQQLMSWDAVAARVDRAKSLTNFWEMPAPPDAFIRPGFVLLQICASISALLLQSPGTAADLEARLAAATSAAEGGGGGGGEGGAGNVWGMMGGVVELLGAVGDECTDEQRWSVGVVTLQRKHVFAMEVGEWGEKWGGWRGRGKCAWDDTGNVGVVVTQQRKHVFAMEVSEWGEKGYLGVSCALSSLAPSSLSSAFLSSFFALPFFSISQCTCAFVKVRIGFLTDLLAADTWQSHVLPLVELAVDSLQEPSLCEVAAEVVGEMASRHEPLLPTITPHLLSSFSQAAATHPDAFPPLASSPSNATAAAALPAPPLSSAAGTSSMDEEERERLVAAFASAIADVGLAGPAHVLLSPHLRDPFATAALSHRLTISACTGSPSLPVLAHHLCLYWLTISACTGSPSLPVLAHHLCLYWLTISACTGSPSLPVLAHHLCLYWLTISACTGSPSLPVLAHHLCLYWLTISACTGSPSLPVLAHHLCLYWLTISACTGSPSLPVLAHHLWLYWLTISACTGSPSLPVLAHHLWLYWLTISACTGSPSLPVLAHHLCLYWLTISACTGSPSLPVLAHHLCLYWLTISDGSPPVLTIFFLSTCNSPPCINLTSPHPLPSSSPLPPSLSFPGLSEFVSSRLNPSSPSSPALSAQDAAAAHAILLAALPLCLSHAKVVTAAEDYREQLEETLVDVMRAVGAANYLSCAAPVLLASPTPQPHQLLADVSALELQLFASQAVADSDRPVDAAWACQVLTAVAAVAAAAATAPQPSIAPRLQPWAPQKSPHHPPSQQVHRAVAANVLVYLSFLPRVPAIVPALLQSLSQGLLPPTSQQAGPAGATPTPARGGRRIGRGSSRASEQATSACAAALCALCEAHNSEEPPPAAAASASENEGLAAQLVAVGEVRGLLRRLTKSSALCSVPFEAPQNAPQLLAVGETLHLARLQPKQEADIITAVASSISSLPPSHLLLALQRLLHPVLAALHAFSVQRQEDPHLPQYLQQLAPSLQSHQMQSPDQPLLQPAETRGGIQSFLLSACWPHLQFLLSLPSSSSSSPTLDRDALTSAVAAAARCLAPLATLSGPSFLPCTESALSSLQSAFSASGPPPAPLSLSLCPPILRTTETLLSLQPLTTADQLQFSTARATSALMFFVSAPASMALKAPKGAEQQPELAEALLHLATFLLNLVPPAHMASDPSSPVLLPLSNLLQVAARGCTAAHRGVSASSFAFISALMTAGTQQAGLLSLQSHSQQSVPPLVQLCTAQGALLSHTLIAALLGPSAVSRGQLTLKLTSFLSPPPLPCSPPGAQVCGSAAATLPRVLLCNSRWQFPSRTGKHARLSSLPPGFLRAGEAEAVLPAWLAQLASSPPPLAALSSEAEWGNTRMLRRLLRSFADSHRHTAVGA
ncbi:unnamed protein product [Closterium sp. NIES-65]|nr:unnamed protein product [Closterium sp. NIES-65]